MNQQKEGAKIQTKVIEETWKERSLFWNIFLPRNAFQMLRNVICMEYTPDKQDGDERTVRRKRLRGHLQVKFPAPPREEQILTKTKEEDFDFILHKPLNVFAIPGEQQWKAFDPDIQMPDGADFRGCIFHPVDIMKGFGLEPADPPFDCRIEWKKFGLFIWSDGGRVDTNKVFSILRLIDCYHDLTERMFPTFASVRGIWFQLLGRESDLKHVSDLRVKHLRQMERQIWTMTKPDNSKIYIKVEVKFISGDNKLLWTEAGIGGKDYRCAHCTCRATHQHWMRYKPLDIRNSPLSPYSDRTLLYQGIAYIDSNDGVCRVPPLNQLSCRRSSAIIFTCAVMHNIRGVLRVFSFRCAFVGIVSTQPNS